MTVGIRERDIAGGQCRPEQFVFPSRFVPFAAWRESRHYRVVVARGGINLSLMSRHSEVCTRSNLNKYNLLDRKIMLK